MKIRTLTLCAVTALAVTVATATSFAQAEPRRPGPPPATTETQTLPPLTIEQVRTIASAHLLMQRSDMTVGKITDKDAYSYEIQFLAADGSVARHTLVDKITGRPGGMGMGGMGGMGCHDMMGKNRMAK